ncbi:ABCB family ABC transporter ATP-binding protein/permease [Haliea sp. E17]|uniref:ABCB family ABC transporter ATP-binding protein/permease n=1 Tax=Haliea sp. E17 TaxID=3401576 RepID=UPI003AAAE35A
MPRSSKVTFDPDTSINWRILRHLVPYLLESPYRVILAMACLVAAKGAVLVIPFLLKYLVDALDGADLASLAPALLLGLVLAYGGARFANVFFGELRDTIFGRVTERAMRRVGLQIFRHVHSLDLEYHLGRRTGGLARDIERGVTGIGFLLRFFVFNIAPTLFEISMVVGIFLFNYGPSYALVTLVAVVAYGFYSLYATEWRTRFVREMNEADSASNTRAVDSLLNFETVKYFTNEDFEARRYDSELQRWEMARRNNRLSLFVLNGGQALIIALAQTAIIGLAAWQVKSGDITLGDFILINQFMIQLFLPLGFLGFVFREIKGSMANIEKMFELMAVQPNVVDRAGAGALDLKAGGIVFEGVNFGYSAERQILHDVSLRVNPGEKVAVVGPSGSGKSTLVKLLFRFYDPQSGRVEVDGQDIAGVTQESLRRAIGIVPQDTVLFNDTIFENVRYGNPGASDADVSEAIRLAHLDHFIAALPRGGETLVGERGLKLSGGEKQRVSIARTILKRPPIMVFDEATSSLDSHSEQAILQALREIARGHTSLVIAHRLSTIVDADRIVVLEGGRVVESGSHAELLAQQGAYAALWLAQQRAENTNSVTKPATA